MCAILNVLRTVLHTSTVRLCYRLRIRVVTADRGGGQEAAGNSEAAQRYVFGAKQQCGKSQSCVVVQ